MSGSICFIGLDNYPVLNPDYGAEYFGGESVQQTLLAKAFVNKGYTVSMIVRDHGQPDAEMRDGVLVLKTFKPGRGIKGLRYVHPRMTSVTQALKQADADIYYHSCAGLQTGLVARFCVENNRCFVFRIAHDTDCIPGQELIKFFWERYIYRYGLRHADLIVAQGAHQADLLKENLALSSVVINMTVDIPLDEPGRDRDIDVLWVNNLRPFKRPDLAIELAKRLTGKRVVMIGGPSKDHEKYFEEMRDRSTGVSSLEFMGAIPYDRVNDYFSRSRLFVNTSDSEGFPNSFLQAWSRRVPVISFFDPDELIATHGLGLSPAGLDEMANSVNELLADPEALAAAGNRSREFVLERYSPASVAAAYIEQFEQFGRTRN